MNTYRVYARWKADVEIIDVLEFKRHAWLLKQFQAQPIARISKSVLQRSIGNLAIVRHALN